MIPTVGLGTAVGMLVAVGRGVAVGARVAVGVGLGAIVGLGLGVGLGCSVGVGLGEDVGLGLGSGVIEAIAVGVSVESLYTAKVLIGVCENAATQRKSSTMSNKATEAFSVDIFFITLFCSLLRILFFIW